MPRTLNKEAIALAAEFGFHRQMRLAKPSMSSEAIGRLWRDSTQARTIWREVATAILGLGETMDATGVLYETEPREPVDLDTLARAIETLAPDAAANLVRHSGFASVAAFREAHAAKRPHALALHRLGPGKSIAGPVSAILARIRAEQQGQPLPLAKIEDMGVIAVDEAETAPRGPAPWATGYGGTRAVLVDELKASDRMIDPSPRNTREFRNFGDLGAPPLATEPPAEIFPDDPRPDRDAEPEEYAKWKTRNFGRLYGQPQKRILTGPGALPLSELTRDEVRSIYGEDDE